MEALRERIADYTDEELLSAYSQRGEYTEEAVKIYEEEIARRGLDAKASEAEVKQERTATAAFVTAAAMKNLSREDFVPLPGHFKRADVLIANTVLSDSDVPYTIEECASDNADDTDDNSEDSLHGSPCGASCEKNLSSKLFDVLVYKDAQDTARAIIDEHFALGGDGRYALLSPDVTERLKAFSFSDIRMSDEAAREQFDVDLTDAEKSSLIKLARFLLDEADDIEEHQNRMLFFYDGLETLIGKLTKGEKLTRVDFLAIIELCQVYCEDERYDAALDQTASSILSFFLE